VGSTIGEYLVVRVIRHTLKKAPLTTYELTWLVDVGERLKCPSWPHPCRVGDNT